ncbi:MAG: response regulator [Amphiplicatus sp.]
MPAGRVSVFCIDPDKRANGDLRALLRAHNPLLEAQPFQTGEAALEAHRAAPADIIIADLRLPGMTGVDLVAAMQAAAPGSAAILVASAIDLASAVEAVNRARVARLLQKPLDAARLSEAIDAALAELALRDRRALADLSLIALAQARIAVAVLSADLRLAYANDEAVDIIRNADAFSLGPKEELRGANAEETSKLHDFFEASASAAGGAGVLRLSRGPGRLPVIVSALFAPGAAPQTGAYNLVLTDPEKRSAPAPEEIAQALGISPSEARIVHGLVLGMDVGEAAKSAGVSLATARTYLRNSFSKTGVTRQAELVRLALLTAA